MVKKGDLFWNIEWVDFLRRDITDLIEHLRATLLLDNLQHTLKPVNITLFVGYLELQVHDLRPKLFFTLTLLLDTLSLCLQISLMPWD